VLRPTFLGFFPGNFQISARFWVPFLSPKNGPKNGPQILVLMGF
jgi:hypothetical protein